MNITVAQKQFQEQTKAAQQELAKQQTEGSNQFDAKRQEIAERWRNFFAKQTQSEASANRESDRAQKLHDRQTGREKTQTARSQAKAQKMDSQSERIGKRNELRASKQDRKEERDKKDTDHSQNKGWQQGLEKMVNDQHNMVKAFGKAQDQLPVTG